MKRSIAILVFALITSQRSPAQVTDVAPSGTQNLLPVEGGSIRMKIDSITPLKDLISQLNQEWQLLETGKGYWIGYTNDMFSIAAHGDSAVAALSDFCKTTDSDLGKTGAILTLHLVGINRTIVGRFSEKFTNQKARAALLDLLKGGTASELIMSLLMRDPWPSDIPCFFGILKNNRQEEIAWPIVNALRRYRLPGLPIGSVIPQHLEKLAVKLNVEKEHVMEPGFDFNSQLKEALKTFSNQFPHHVQVEDKLYEQRLPGDFNTELGSSLTINQFLNSIGIAAHSAFSYVELGCRLQYYVEDDVLHFCTIATAADRLIDWWEKLPAGTKEKF
jgi:hypothetical protein